MPRKRIAAVVVVLLAIGAIVVAWRGRHATRAVQYETAAVTRGSVARTVTASGTVNPVTVVQVGTYVSGVIQEVHCDYNTKVVKGQLCATIDPRPYQSALDQDQANLDSGRAQLEKDQTSLEYAQITYRRNLDLGRQGLVPQDTVDSSKSVADQAQAQVELDRTVVEQRQAALSSAQVNLGYTRIVSPVDGTVVSRSVTTGQTVAASFQTPTLFLIATDLTKMQVDANVSESDIGQAKTGSSASFSVEAYPRRSFLGTVTQVRQAPQTVQNVVTYDVVVSVANPELLLKPGMTATVHIVSEERKDALRLPDTALRYVPGGAVAAARGGGDRSSEIASEEGESGPVRVWTLRNGRPEPMMVTVGLEGDTYAELVNAPLKPGDLVIVSEKGPAAAAPSRPRMFRF